MTDREVREEGAFTDTVPPYGIFILLFSHIFPFYVPHLIPVLLFSCIWFAGMSFNFSFEYKN
jgi:hypothetical protein